MSTRGVAHVPQLTVEFDVATPVLEVQATVNVWHEEARVVVAFHRAAVKVRAHACLKKDGSDGCIT